MELDLWLVVKIPKITHIFVIFTASNAFFSPITNFVLKQTIRNILSYIDTTPCDLASFE